MTNGTAKVPWISELHFHLPASWALAILLTVHPWTFPKNDTSCFLRSKLEKSSHL